MLLVRGFGVQGGEVAYKFAPWRELGGLACASCLRILSCRGSLVREGRFLIIALAMRS